MKTMEGSKLIFSWVTDAYGLKFHIQIESKNFNKKPLD